MFLYISLFFLLLLAVFMKIAKAETTVWARPAAAVVSMLTTLSMFIHVFMTFPKFRYPLTFVALTGGMMFLLHLSNTKKLVFARPLAAILGCVSVLVAMGKVIAVLTEVDERSVMPFERVAVQHQSIGFVVGKYVKGNYPNAKLLFLHRAGINEHSIQDFLDGMALEVKPEQLAMAKHEKVPTDFEDDNALSDVLMQAIDPHPDARLVITTVPPPIDVLRKLYKKHKGEMKFILVTANIPELQAVMKARMVVAAVARNGKKKSLNVNEGISSDLQQVFDQGYVFASIPKDGGKPAP